MYTSRMFLSACIMAGLAACGGGSGGGNEPPPPIAQEDPQGFWGGSASTGADLAALVTDTGEIWAIGVSQGSAVSLLWGKGETRGTTYEGSGYEYFPGSATAGTFTAEVDTKNTLKGSATGASTITFELKYDSSYETPADQGQIEGSWATADNSARFDIDPSGNVTGVLISADTGFQPCGFSGTATAHQSKNYYDISLVTSSDIGCQPYMNTSYKGVIIKDYGGISETLLMGAVNSDNSHALLTVAILD